MRRRAVLAVVVAVLALCARPAAAQPRQIGTLLVAGWNNIGYVGATRPVAAALGPAYSRVESVWAWDAQAQRWLGFTPLVPASGDFSELRQNQAYWIRMAASAELVMDVPPAQPSVTLAAGWNNFVYPGPERPISDALAPAQGRFDSVWRWDAARQSWNAFSPMAPAASDFSTLGPSRSYFMRLADGAPVTMPAPGPAPAPAATPAQGGTPAPGGTPATPTPAPKPRTCYTFQTYQPQMAEVSRAQTRAAFGVLTADPDFKLKELATQTDGKGLPVTPYVPPTLLKAIGWVESGWRQASFTTPRGSTGPTVTSSSCAYGLMQVLTGMNIDAAPNARQMKIGTEFLSNIAAGAQILGAKWNLAPDHIPVVLPRNPRSLEDWYYAVWAYHCYGEVCQALGIHNNPEDPALKWPRPAYNSPDQLASAGQFSFSDYPYQELVYGVVANPPKVNNTPVWQPLPVTLPPRGAVGYPDAKAYLAPSVTLDPTTADAP